MFLQTWPESVPEEGDSMLCWTHVNAWMLVVWGALLGCVGSSRRRSIHSDVTGDPIVKWVHVVHDLPNTPCIWSINILTCIYQDTRTRASIDSPLDVEGCPFTTPCWYTYIMYSLCRYIYIYIMKYNMTHGPWSGWVYLCISLPWMSWILGSC